MTVKVIVKKDPNQILRESGVDSVEAIICTFYNFDFFKWALSGASLL